MAKVSGVYQILNIKTNTRYIGSAADFNKRWSVHKSHLKRNKHHSPKLQNAWNKYGEESFAFQPLFNCATSVMINMEQLYIDLFDFEKELYNISKYTTSGFLGRKHTNEAKIKIANKSRQQKHTPETIEKIRSILTGQKRTEEQRKRLVDGHKKYIRSKRGPYKIKSEEYINIINMYTTENYSYEEIANKYNVSRGTITLIVKRGGNL